MGISVRGIAFGNLVLGMLKYKTDFGRFIEPTINRSSTKEQKLKVSIYGWGVELFLLMKSTQLLCYRAGKE